MSLISEAMGYRELSNTIQRMVDLRTLRFPRSAAKHMDFDTKSHMRWPPRLNDVTLSGDLSEFVDNDVCSDGLL